MNKTYLRSKLSSCLEGNLLQEPAIRVLVIDPIKRHCAPSVGQLSARPQTLMAVRQIPVAHISSDADNPGVRSFTPGRCKLIGHRPNKLTRSTLGGTVVGWRTFLDGREADVGGAHPVRGYESPHQIIHPAYMAGYVQQVAPTPPQTLSKQVDPPEVPTGYTKQLLSVYRKPQHLRKLRKAIAKESGWFRV